MNTKQVRKSVQTEADKQSTKQLGLSNVKGDKLLSLKKLTPTSDIIQAGVLENGKGEQEWYHLFLGRNITKKEEARESMEELNKLTPSEILELCARMILTNTAIEKQIENQLKNGQTTSTTTNA